MQLNLIWVVDVTHLIHVQRRPSVINFNNNFNKNFRDSLDEVERGYIGTYRMFWNLRPYDQMKEETTRYLRPLKRTRK